MEKQRIYTGYFSYTKKYKEAGLLPISIAKVTPKWFDGLKCGVFAPDSKTLWRYKEGEIGEEQYTKEYLQTLSNVDSNDVLKKEIKKNLKEAQKQGLNGVIYLCYEKNGDFCHRHILAEYLNKSNVYQVEEYKI